MTSDDHGAYLEMQDIENLRRASVLWTALVAFEKWQNSPDPDEDFRAIRVALLLSQGHGAPNPSPVE